MTRHSNDTVNIKKSKPSKLTLHRETIRELVDPREEKILGLATGRTCRILSCGGGTCTCPPAV